MITQQPAVPGQLRHRRPWLVRHFGLLATTVWACGTVIAWLFGYTLLHASLAMLLLVQCTYPSVRFMVDRSTVVPAVPILSAAFALQFALPVFLGDGTLWVRGGYRQIDPDAISFGLVIANLAFAGFLIVCYSRAVTSAIGKLPAIDLHLNPTRALVFCFVFGGLALISSRIFPTLATESQPQFAAMFRILQTQLLVAIGVLAWLTYTYSSVWLRLIYYAFIAAAVTEGMASGFLEAALVPIGIMFACQWIYERRINKTVAVLIAAGMLLLNPVKADFRQAVWFGYDAPQGRLEKAELWLATGIDFWKSVLSGEARAEDATEQLVRRTSLIHLLSHVVEMTPSIVPYYTGETYSYFAYSLIPRVLWPDKPVTSANKTLAVEYDLTTAEGAERSTFGISIVGEGYANFGIVGSVLIMVVLGIALRSTQTVFATERSGPGGYALFLAFFVFFLNGLGSSAEILLGNLLQNMIVSSLLMYWVSDRRARRRRPGAPPI